MSAPGKAEPTRCSGCGRVIAAEGGGVCPVCALEDVAATLDETGEGSPEAERLVLDDLLPAGELRRRVGRYELHELLGAGGMGVVYRAWQADLQRWVAIKLLPPAWFEVPEARERFLQEARALARLQHPNIVAIHDFGEHEGQLYLVMEFVEGTSLQQRSGQWLATPEKAADYVRAAALAMQAAHAKDVLHRDLKPSNLLLGHDDRVRITDFGLARGVEGGSKLTRPDQVLGTLAYLAPEQVREGPAAASVRSDVYSLGAVLYELVTGRPPHVANAPATLLREVAQTDPPSPALLNPLVPRALEVICLKCLEKDPRDRYATAGELAADLGRFLAHQKVQARSPSRLRRARRWARLNPGWASAGGLALVLGLVLAVGGVLKLKEQWDAVRTRLASGQEAEARERVRDYARQLDEVRRALAAHDNGEALQRLEATPRDQRGWEYGLLRHLPQAGHRSWLAHSVLVTCVAANAQGDRIASGDWRGNVRLWEAASGRLLHHQRLHQWRVNSVQFSADGRHLLTSSEDRTACVIEVATGALHARHESKAVLNQAVFYGAEAAVLTVNDLGRLEWWRSQEGGPSATVLVRRNRLLALDVHGRLGAYAAGDDLGRIHVGRVEEGLAGDGEEGDAASAAGPMPKRTWLGHGAPVSSVAWCPVDHRLASAAVNGEVRLWDPATGELVRTLREAGSAVGDLAWSPDGQWVAAPLAEGGLAQWAVSNPESQEVFLPQHGGMTSVAFLDREGRFVSAGKDRRLHVSGARAGTTGEHSNSHRFTGVVRMRFAHRAPWWVGGGAAGELWRLDLGSGTTNWNVLSAVGRVAALAVTPDDAWVIGGGQAGLIEVRDSATGTELRRYQAGAGMVRALAVHPRHPWLAAGGDDRTVRLLDLETGQARHAYPPHSARIGRLMFSPDGQYVMWMGADQRWVAYGLGGHDTNTALRLPVTVEGFDVGADGLVVTVGRRGGAQVWQLPGLKLVATTEGNPDGLRAVALTPDGRRLLTADDSGAVRCWHAQFGIQVLHVPLLGSPVRDLRFSPDGSRLAVLGVGGDLLLSSGHSEFSN